LLHRGPLRVEGNLWHLRRLKPPVAILAAFNRFNLYCRSGMSD
jgi:hypothetical protein